MPDNWFQAHVDEATYFATYCEKEQINGLCNLSKHDQTEKEFRCLNR